MSRVSVKVIIMMMHHGKATTLSAYSVQSLISIITWTHFRSMYRVMQVLFYNMVFVRTLAKTESIHSHLTVKNFKAGLNDVVSILHILNEFLAVHIAEVNPCPIPSNSRIFNMRERLIRAGVNNNQTKYDRLAIEMIVKLFPVEVFMEYIIRMDIMGEEEMKPYYWDGKEDKEWKYKELVSRFYEEYFQRPNSGKKSTLKLHSITKMLSDECMDRPVPTTITHIVDRLEFLCKHSPQIIAHWKKRVYDIIKLSPLGSDMYGVTEASEVEYPRLRIDRQIISKHMYANDIEDDYMFKMMMAATGDRIIYDDDNKHMSSLRSIIRQLVNLIPELILLYRKDDEESQARLLPKDLYDNCTLNPLYRDAGAILASSTNEYGHIIYCLNSDGCKKNFAQYTIPRVSKTNTFEHCPVRMDFTNTFTVDIQEIISGYGNNRGKMFILFKLCTDGPDKDKNAYYIDCECKNGSDVSWNGMFSNKDKNSIFYYSAIYPIKGTEWVIYMLSDLLDNFEIHTELDPDKASSHWGTGAACRPPSADAC